MERRAGLRGTTNFPVKAYDGFGVHDLEAVGLSASGVVLRHGDLPRRERPLFCSLELLLPERVRGVTVLARSVRLSGRDEAFRFVEVADSDRLTLAEHLDVLYRRGALGETADRRHAVRLGPEAGSS